MAWAAIPANDGTIKGCYAKSSGVLGLSYSKWDVRSNSIAGYFARCVRIHHGPRAVG